MPRKCVKTADFQIPFSGGASSEGLEWGQQSVFWVTDSFSPYMSIIFGEIWEAPLPAMVGWIVSPQNSGLPRTSGWP